MSSSGEIDAGLASKLEPSRTALLVVDMQNDYVAPEGALMVWQKERWANLEGFQRTLDEVVPTVEGLIRAARGVGVLPIWARTVLTPATDSRFWRAQGQETCRAGTWGAEIFDALRPHDDDIVISKRRHSAFFGTHLDSVLRGNGIETVVVTGVGTHGCVESTVRDAMTLDYWAVVPSDGCGTGDLEAHAAALVRIGRLFGFVTESPAIVETWEAASVHARAN
jgi:nicotinamidase-related amidase